MAKKSYRITATGHPTAGQAFGLELPVLTAETKPWLWLAVSEDGTEYREEDGLSWDELPTDHIQVIHLRPTLLTLPQQLLARPPQAGTWRAIFGRHRQTVGTQAGISSIAFLTYAGWRKNDRIWWMTLFATDGRSYQSQAYQSGPAGQ